MLATKRLSKFRNLTKCLRMQYRCQASTSNQAILNDDYFCSDEWELRRQGSGLKDLNPYEFMASLIVRHQSNQLISAVDFDIAANAVNMKDQLVDLEDLIFRFRHTKNAVNMLDSTHYAIFRAYTDFGQEEKLMKLLEDRINNGIFPDCYGANLLINKFLQAGNSRDAAKISFYLMLQEDFSVESTRWLMILSCLKYLENPWPENWVETSRDTSNGNDDDDEEIIFRLPWLKNRYSDDHFDLTQPEMLIGKTLHWCSDFCLKISNDCDSDLDRCLFLNAKLLGLLLRRDAKNLTIFFQQNQLQQFDIFNDLAQRIENFLSQQDSTAVQANSNDSQKQKENVDEFDDTICKNPDLKILLQTFVKSAKVSHQNFLQAFELRLKEKLPKFQIDDVYGQKREFKRWNEIREEKIQRQIERYLKSEKVKMIEKELVELESKDQHMFFFENKEELEKSLARRQAAVEAAKPKPKLVPIRRGEYITRKEKKLMAKQLSKKPPADLPSDEDYSIPEIHKRG